MWPLFGVGDGHWTDSRDLVLIGDAAHAMLPFAAQGAVMAIEDAYDLAGMVNTMPVGAALVTLNRFDARVSPGSAPAAISTALPITRGAPCALRAMWSLR